MIMSRTILVACIMMCSSAFIGAATLWAQEKPRYAGPVEGGFLLPNGWTISPAGRQVPLTDLPLNIIPLPDNRRVLVATSGYNAHELTLIDLPEAKKLDTQTVRESWYGLVLSPMGEKVWWSGGGGNQRHEFHVEGAKLIAADAAAKKEPPKANNAPQEAKKETKPAGKNFQSGMALDAKRQVLYWLDIDAGAITSIDLSGKRPDKTTTIGGRPYDVALARNGAHLYVSDWAGRSVLVLDPVDLRVVSRIAVGEHPNQIAVHPKDNRIFVACASSNAVMVIDTVRGVVTETIATALFPRSPEGSTPDAVAVSADGKTLFVANADNNCIVVVDLDEVNQSIVKGFIPTGWYPTAVAVTPDGKNLLVGVGKGNQTKPNPITPPKEGEAATKSDAKAPAKADAPPSPTKARPFPYIGTTLSGALSIVPVPDEKQLAAYTEIVYRNCPYSDKLLTSAPHPHKTAIPNKVGEPSPIKHVIYVIKENRTYDQVFGDMPRGNGDPSLVLFGENVTPNHHKLANEFVLLDNLYCNGHVSADGHPWSTMAYNTDYIARNWALTYSKRSGVDDDDEGNLSKGPSGYLWDACARAGLSYRNYGEYGTRVSQPDGSFTIDGRVPGLKGHTCPTFNFFGEQARDTERMDAFLAEFREFERNGNLPRLIIMSLGEDHTFGTKVGSNTPRACVASNDLALGRLVDAVSHSKFWPETAIFVIEDDAQNGPDHVDAHRTVGLVISPYVRRGHLDSSQYSTVSMIRTMELILGLPPLSQYDAAARPMFESFTDKADLKPYEVADPRIDLKERNRDLAYGADRSGKMDFSDCDKIDDFELNEILWRSIKGANAPLPPAVRRAIAFRSFNPQP